MTGKQRVLSAPFFLDDFKHIDEAVRIQEMLDAPALSEGQRTEAANKARAIIVRARRGERKKGMIETFLEEFGLSNAEGLALMCLAEALLRVPDAETRDKLIAEKIRSGKWEDHRGQSDSLLVNASTWGLMLTGKIVRPPADAENDPSGFMARMVREAGEPVIRASMMQAMRIMGEQFVLGRTINEAVKRGERMIRKDEAANFSFDMLGEGARTYSDAERYFRAYEAALADVGAAASGKAPEVENGVSVKLSALHPSYHALQSERVHAELYPKLLSLCEQAKSSGVNLCVDAEEADRLVLSLGLFERLAREPRLGGWDGLGLALQAYQKRSEKVADWLVDLSSATNRRFMVRLVKGAYWDSEIKHAQVEGAPHFPVFTTKQATDVSYLTCAKTLLSAKGKIFPQFATHNANSLAAIEILAKEAGAEAYEFQRLHGMGEALYAAAERGDKVRVYAPVGQHEDLLPYLVRRLLENGANTSFVHSFMDEDVPPEAIAADPFAALAARPHRHPRIPAPRDLFGDDRRNSDGHDLTQASVQERLVSAISKQNETSLSAKPIVSGKEMSGAAISVTSPQDKSSEIGSVVNATDKDIEDAFSAASAFQPSWDRLGGSSRAEILRAMANAMEENGDALMALMAREAGKTLNDGVAELREAVDFCRYYAAEAEDLFAEAKALPGPAGETNHLALHGRGVFVCISPWNFPLAIFTGQIAAALAAGNTVLAKPAEQTPLVAKMAVELFHKAGLPGDALHLLPGEGHTVGAKLVEDKRTAGVAFTGSTQVARIINRTLAEKDGPIVPLIAETGGLNAMFVDTTALKEQVVDDVITSAFGSCGQRCSALRLLFLPNETADDLITCLKGAMDALVIGDPANPATDVGPLVDADAQVTLKAHHSRMASEATILHALNVSGLEEKGHFFGPTVAELKSLDQIESEVFGPYLHVIRYDNADLEKLGRELSDKGYGLTLGVHSRLERFAGRVQRSVRAGNVYVNRSMIGAVVGVQPFGGEGLSGTGPKAGGPNYLPRFAAERTVTVDITAQGGDPSLLNLT